MKTLAKIQVWRSHKSAMMLSLAVAIVGLTSIAVVANGKRKRDRNSYTQTWVYKLRDDLILAIVPLELEFEPLDKVALRTQFPNPQLPTDGSVADRNCFFMPGTSAPENPKLFYSNNMNDRMGKPLDRNVVCVGRITPWTDAMYRLQPEAVRDARVGWKNNTSAALVAKHPIFEKDGMQCYVLFRNTTMVGIQDWKEGTCIAERAPGEWALFEFGSGPSGYIRTEYFTKAYGGLSVSWNTSYRNFDRWREIDAKLWQLLESRNLAKLP